MQHSVSDHGLAIPEIDGAHNGGNYHKGSGVRPISDTIISGLSGLKLPGIHVGLFSSYRAAKAVFFQHISGSTTLCIRDLEGGPFKYFKPFSLPYIFL